MSATISTLTLARNEAHDWSLRPDNVPAFPPVALPGAMTATQVYAYAKDLLEAAHVPVPDQLNWRVVGHTPDGTYVTRARWKTEVVAL
jgi:hypothetical protein